MGSDTGCGKCVICYVIFIFWGVNSSHNGYVGFCVAVFRFFGDSGIFFLLGSYCDVSMGIRQYYHDFGRTPMKHLEFIFGESIFFLGECCRRRGGCYSAIAVYSVLFKVF